MHDATYTPPASLDVLRQRSLMAGLAGIAALAVGAFLDSDQFFRSYLLAFLFWLAAAMGGLALAMLQHMTGGNWGVVLRRVFEASARTLPWMALLFVPVAFGLSRLYPWTNDALVAADHILSKKQLYLNEPFFLARAAFYFAVWVGLAFFLTTWSARQDRTGDAALKQKMRALSAVGIVAYAFTMTFAAFDWGMSLDPHWFSTMYGFLFIIGQLLMGLAVAIVVARRLSAEAPMASVFNVGHWHDFGKLLFAFAMVWTYLSFSQFLIIWSANLPEEIPWYMHRTSHGWQYLAVGLIAVHFVVPFAVLLSRRTKRNSAVLARMALWLIMARFVDVFFLIGPEFHQDGLAIHWMDLAAMVGIGGVWTSLFAAYLKSRPLLPLQDPDLAGALKATGGH
ncbi:MAG: hypothetical protein Q7V01_07335 [Vicinamibacterales bacterium]|nr:hypothetical protein [Vicinamibacterales bacterium]